MPKSLRSRLEVLEVASRIGAAPIAVMLREPAPGEVDRHLAARCVAVMVFNIEGRTPKPTDRTAP